MAHKIFVPTNFMLCQAKAEISIALERIESFVKSYFNGSQREEVS